MEEFDSIVFRAKLGGTWTDITGDVLVNPRPAWNVGIMGNGPLDRVGDPETLTFSLNNSASNSGGLLGYYSPGHTNCRTGWKTGIEVQLYFTYDNRTTPYYEYYGHITPDGISVEPGTKGRRTVAVTCIGFMGRAADHDLDLIELAQNQTIESAAALIVANMPIQPLATDYGTGVSTFPTVFDTVTTGTKASAEFNKLALSELGYIHTTPDRAGGQTLVVRGRDDLVSMPNTNIPLSESESGLELLETGDFELLETGDFIILDETTTASFSNTMLADGAEMAYGKHFANRIRTNAYPRKVGTTNEVLWTLQNEIEIPANSTKTDIRGAYRDPDGGSKTVKGTDMVTPVSGTDFIANSQRDGGGSIQTANMSVTATLGVAEAAFPAITNSSGASIWTGGDAGTFQVRGKIIRFYDVVTNVIDDHDSQITQGHGVKELEIDMKYQDDPTVTDGFARYTLNNTKDPKTTMERIPLIANTSPHNMNAFLTLKPGTRAAFVEDMTAISGDYFIMGYDAELVAGKYVYWYPVTVKASEMDFTLWENGYSRFTEEFSAGVSGDLSFDNVSAISTGGAQLYTGTAITNHATVWTLLSHASNANSGYRMRYIGEAYTLPMGGLEYILYFSPQHANTVGFFGMVARDGSANLTDGIYFRLAASLALKGEALNAATAPASNTATSYTLTEDAWYRVRVHINQAGTLATFELYSEYGILLWSDTLSTDFPATSTSLYPDLQFTYSGSPSGQQTIAYVDYCTAGFQHD